MGESPAAHTTAYLLDRARDGDLDARADLVRRMQPLLERFARGRVPRLMRREQDTSDLVQSTWERVLARLDRVQTQAPGDFFAYLRAILVNALRDGMRSRGREPLRVEPDSGFVEQLAAEHVDPADWLAWEQALAALDGEHRSIVLMRFEFGMSFVEIGHELGVSPDGIRMKLNRTLGRMARAASDDAVA